MHIEPTSRCILSCPGCARTFFIEKLHRPFPKQDLNLDDLEHFLDCDRGREVKNLLLNGNHGDPIYYPHLVELIQRFRDRSIMLSTNGSRMPAAFWHRLAENLEPKDTVFFSIDGLEHDNHLYRRNADWDSIMMGLKIMISSPARVVWKSIIFSYNQNELEQMKAMAHDMGAMFVCEPTGYYGDENLRPQDSRLVRTDQLYHPDIQSDLDPKCSSGGQEFISADGYYWPCCWISNYHVLHRTPLWKERDQWQIKGQNLDQARLKVDSWADQIKSQEHGTPDICKMMCKPGQPNFQWGWI